MAMTRRGFVVTSSVAALGALIAGTLRKLEPAVAAAAPALRPAAAGTSSGRCAHCGSAVHTTLAATCAEAGAARAAVQDSARRLAAGRRGAGA